MKECKYFFEQLVQRNEKFNGKDASLYLRDYKAEML